MSDDAPTWDAVAHALAAAAGVEPRMVHVPSDAIATADPVWGAGPLGDKAHPMVFDTAELRRVVPDFVATVPFEQGAREVVAWHNEDRPVSASTSARRPDGPARRALPPGAAAVAATSSAGTPG